VVACSSSTSVPSRLLMFFQEIRYRGRIMRLMVGSFGFLSSRF